MKHIFFSVLVILFVFTSCGTVAFDDENENISSSEVKTRTVTFTVGEANGETDGTRALSTDVKIRCGYLQYWIYDDSYNNIMANGIQKVDTTENFGTFSAILPYGTYHVVAVGSNNSSAMSLNENGMVVLGESDSRLADTYYANAECKVTADNSTNTTITLERNMCNVYVTSNGSAAKVQKVNVVLKAYGLGFKASDGLSGSDTDDYTYTIDFTDKQRTQTQIRFSIFFPLPQKGTIYDNVGVSLTALDSNGDKLGSADITNIPAKIGRKITYTRNIWSNNSDVNVVVSDEDWEVVNGDE